MSDKLSGKYRFKAIERGDDHIILSKEEWHEIWTGLQNFEAENEGLRRALRLIAHYPSGEMADSTIDELLRWINAMQEIAQEALVKDE